MSKNEEGTKVSTKVIAVLNKDHSWTPAYSTCEVMKTGTQFECGHGGSYINADGNLILNNYAGHGFHHMITKGDFDIYIQETVTEIKKTVTMTPAFVQGKLIIPAGAKMPE